MTKKDLIIYLEILVIILCTSYLCNTKAVTNISNLVALLDVEFIYLLYLELREKWRL
jgi:hypothetical protein